MKNHRCFLKKIFPDVLHQENIVYKESSFAGEIFEALIAGYRAAKILIKREQTVTIKTSVNERTDGIKFIK